MVLKQEKIENEKITRENSFIQEEEFKSKVTDLKSECGYNKTIIQVNRINESIINTSENKKVKLLKKSYTTTFFSFDGIDRNNKLLYIKRILDINQYFRSSKRVTNNHRTFIFQNINDMNAFHASH